MDEWDVKITALEVANIDITDRLIIVEEILLGTLRICTQTFDLVYVLFSEPWVACLSSPCDNGGTCIDVNVDTYVCMCRDGFFVMKVRHKHSLKPFIINRKVLVMPNYLIK